MQNNQLPTKSHVELENNSSILKIDAPSYTNPWLSSLLLNHNRAMH
jgi:hypothetical protein